MKTTSKNLFYLDFDGNFRSIQNMKPTDVNKIHKENNFSVLLSDEYFIYETVKPKIPDSSKKSLLIKNYLSGIYPEELIKNFFSVNQENTTTIVLGKKSFDVIYEKYRDIFRRAVRISTPAVESLINHRQNIFNLENYALKADSTISYDSNTKGKNDNMLLDFPNLTYNLLGKSSNTLDNARSLYPFLIAVGISIILFGMGKHFQMLVHKEKLQNLEFKIQEIYKSAGVNKDGDPYGKMLYLANKAKSPDKLVFLPVFEKLSTSFDKPDRIDSLQLKDGYLNIEGKTTDFKTLDVIKNNLKTSFQDKTEIINTNIQKEHVTFSIKVGL